MKLSIVTVNYNNLPGFILAAESVVSQTWDDFEWLVIDGGSTDGFGTYAEGIQSRFAYFVSEPDNGIYDAMNKGIRQAKGDYILFLNSGDSLAAPDVLERVFADNHSEQILYGDYYATRYGEVVRKVSFPSEVDLSYFVESGTFNNILHNASFINTKALKEKMYDTSYKIAADWVFWVQAAYEGLSFRHLDIVVTKYDIDGLSSRDENMAAMMRERERFVHDLLPQSMIDVIADNNEIRKYLSNISSRDFINLRAKHGLLGKAVTLLILLMRKLG